MPRSGRQPAAGLGKRVCAGCGKEFQPYRDYQIACSRPCREKTRDQSPRREAQVLICGRCGKEFTAMWSGLGSRRPSCETCTAEIARAKMDRMNARRRIDPAHRARWRDANFRRAGMTEQQFEDKAAAQGGVCILCGDPPKPGTGPATRRLHIDHDHVTGKLRDLLCNNCNRGLGYFKDDPALLRAAAEYIDRHRMEVS